MYLVASYCHGYIALVVQGRSKAILVEQFPLGTIDRKSLSVVQLTGNALLFSYHQELFQKKSLIFSSE